MEDRIHELEIKVAVMEDRMMSLTTAVEKNTAAQQQVAEALASIKGGKAVFISLVVAAFSVIGLIVSWVKGG